MQHTTRMTAAGTSILAGLQDALAYIKLPGIVLAGAHHKEGLTQAQIECLTGRACGLCSLPPPPFTASNVVNKRARR
jgi:hypothetical protein